MALVSTTGTLTATTGTSSIVSLGLSGENTVLCILSGTYGSVSVIVEASIVSGQWIPVGFTNVGTGQTNYAALALTDNASIAFVLPAGAYQSVRVRCTARSSGTVNVVLVNTVGIVEKPFYGLNKMTAKNLARLTASVAAGTTTADSVAVASGPGILNRIMVTTAGTAVINIVDSATVSSGMKSLFTSGSTYAQGTVTEVNLPFTTGLTVAKLNGSAAVTLGYTLY